MSSAVGIRLLCCSTCVISCSGMFIPSCRSCFDLVNPNQRLPLEVKPKRKLNLPVRSQPNRALYCLSQQSERSTSLRLRETTARLEIGRSDNTRCTDGRQCVVQCRRRNREVRKVEDVENLSSELE